MAGKTAFSSLLGGPNSIGRQLLVWNILGGAVGELMEPVLQQVMDEVWPLLPSRPLSLADVSDMVVKNIMSQADAEAEAKRTGFNADRLHQMILATGEPMSIGQALEALRRGVIPENSSAEGGPSFYKALRESHIRDEWGPTFLALQWLPLPVADAVDAVVEGQLSFADGAAQAKINGVAEDVFQILVNTRGRPPSPSELVELYRRGHIPLTGTGPQATSFQQGIYEGASKDKWWELYAKLGEYLPPPRTITAMLREGALSNAQGAQLLKEAGLSDELAAAYIKAATNVKLAKPRELALTVVLDLYEGHAVNEADATKLIEHLGYDAAEASYLLSLHDIQRTLKAINSAIQHVGTLYIARKLDATSANEALSALGVAKPHADELMAVWDLERRKTVRELTPAQIASAVYYKVMAFDVAVAKLVALGYSEDDAKVVVDIRLHGVPATPVAPPAAA